MDNLQTEKFKYNLMTVIKFLGPKSGSEVTCLKNLTDKPHYPAVFETSPYTIATQQTDQTDRLITNFLL